MITKLFVAITILYVLSVLAHIWEIDEIEIIKKKIKELYDTKDNKG